MPRAIPTLPRLLDTSPAGIQAWANQLTLALETALQDLAAPRGPALWPAPSGYATDRTFDAGTATAADTANTLATAIADLRAAGVLPS